MGNGIQDKDEVERMISVEIANHRESIRRLEAALEIYRGKGLGETKRVSSAKMKDKVLHVACAKFAGRVFSAQDVLDAFLDVGVPVGWTRRIRSSYMYIRTILNDSSRFDYVSTIGRQKFYKIKDGVCDRLKNT